MPTPKYLKCKIENFDNIYIINDDGKTKPTVTMKRNINQNSEKFLNLENAKLEGFGLINQASKNLEKWQTNGGNYNKTFSSVSTIRPNLICRIISIELLLIGTIL